jgi:hypothetical protein
MSHKSNPTVATMSIDIGKNSLHVVGLDRRGAIVLRQKWSRRQIEARLANIPRCLIGMEACVGAHHLSRKLQSHGHDARLMPAKYVHKRTEERLSRRGSNRQAVQCPTVKFVATTADELDLQALHRVQPAHRHHQPDSCLPAGARGWLAMPHRPLRLRDTRYAVLSGTANAIGNALLMYALTLLFVPYVIAIKRMSALFTVIVSGIILKENTRGRLVGTVVMLAGTVLIAFAR